MNLDRRTFTAMLAGTTVAPVVAPRFAFAQGAATKSAFYSGVGPELSHYEVDPDAATLTKRGSVKMGGTIQYAWPHPSRKYLYVTASSGGPGGSGGAEHSLGAFTISPSGELAPHGDVIKLKYRPIHSSVDSAGEYVLVAYNFPSGITVHKIKGDGTIGDTVAQPDNLETGIYFHQVRTSPQNKTVLVVARGNNPEGGKGEDPGSLHVYGFKNGVLSNLHKIQPNGGFGYGPRHLDFHPTQPWVYLSIERQNQLIVYKMTPEGDLITEPLFTKETLADPAHKLRVQGAGTVHVHPNGRFLYQANRSGVTTSTGPGIEDVDGKKVFTGGESNIVVWAINPQTGEPTALQHADIHAAHPRTFALDTSAKVLVAGSLAPTARRENGKVVDIPAGLSVFRVGPDGKLDFVRKYDVDASKVPQWWTGMVPLA